MSSPSFRSQVYGRGGRLADTAWWPAQHQHGVPLALLLHPNHGLRLAVRVQGCVPPPEPGQHGAGSPVPRCGCAAADRLGGAVVVDPGALGLGSVAAPPDPAELAADSLRAPALVHRRGQGRRTGTGEAVDDRLDGRLTRRPVRPPRGRAGSPRRATQSGRRPSDSWRRRAPRRRSPPPTANWCEPGAGGPWRVRQHAAQAGHHVLDRGHRGTVRRWGPVSWLS